MAGAVTDILHPSRLTVRDLLIIDNGDLTRKFWATSIDFAYVVPSSFCLILSENRLPYVVAQPGVQFSILEELSGD